MHRNVYHACRSISFHEDYGFLNITDGIHVPCVHCTLPCIRKWYVHRSLTHRREWKIDETRHEREPILRYSFFFFFFSPSKLRRTSNLTNVIVCIVFISINNFTCKIIRRDEECSFIFERIGQDSLHNVLDEVEVCVREFDGTSTSVIDGSNLIYTP